MTGGAGGTSLLSRTPGFRSPAQCHHRTNTALTLGLGKVFAQSLIKRGKTVYIAGRTESSLAKTAKEIGAAGYFVVDVGDIPTLPAFVEKVTKDAPEVDCLINNAGIQVCLCVVLSRE